MAWNPAGGEPSGWQPSGWQNDSAQPAPLAPMTGTHIVLSAHAQPIRRMQFAGASLPFDLDVGVLAVGSWVPNASIAASELVRPSDGHETGFVYQASAAGQAGAMEPAWPTVAGGTVVDGSITWAAVVPPAAGGDVIQSVTWAQQSPPDAALTISGQSNDALTAIAYLGAGTSGNAYIVIVTILMTSGVRFVAQIILTIL